MTDTFIAVDDENFEPPPDEPRWGGDGPTDRNASPLPPSVQEEEDAENDEAN